jgi:subtilisin family serine protease
MRRKPTFCFSFCFIILISVSTALAQGKIVDESHIRSVLDKRGMIPVIVTFHVEEWRNLAGASAMRRSTVAKNGSMAPGPDAALSSAIGSAAADVTRSMPAGSYTLKRTFSIVPATALSVNEQALEALAANPRVAAIQEDRLSAIPPITAEALTSLDIFAPQLNQSTPLIGADSTWTMGYTGEGVFVAVLDTGVLTSHEMFAGKTFVEACFSTNYSNGIYTSTTVCPNGETTQFGPGAAAPTAGSHGTHVAGIAAGNNPGYSPTAASRGVAPEADIIAVQVFSEFDEALCDAFSEPAPCYLSFSSDQISGLEYVYSLRNSYTIGSVNMSLGGGAHSEHCDTDMAKPIIDQLRQANIATVIATGNNGFCGFVGAPSCISSAVAVGASDKDDIEASYNNYHPTLQELFAPGSSILSATSTSDSSYESWSGTSMATPHVAGAFALLRQAFPEETVDKMEAALRKNGSSITGTCPGALPIPRINVDRAIDRFTAFPWNIFLPAITGQPQP